MADADIGLIGLGVMGANLALNIAENAAPIAVYNRTTERVDSFLAEAGKLRERIVGAHSLEELVASIKKPRAIILMIKAGDPIDQQIEALLPLLDDGDMIIDAGNANFRNTMARHDRLDGSAVSFVGMGVSGGEEGARHGPSIMVGGSAENYKRIEPILKKIAATYDDHPCCAWMGDDGAGHFVKTMHNGIEYADMQMIAEVYGILRDGLDMSASEIGDVFASWQKGRLDSYLIDITATVLKASDPETGQPMVDIILDRAGQKGTGRWAAIEAQTLAIPATTLESAVAARSLSAMRDMRIAAEELYGTREKEIDYPARSVFIDQLEAALYAGKIAAYAQGFAVLQGASETFGWQLPFAEIARIWRAGCIIRSRFLDDIAQALEGSGQQSASLLMLPFFKDAIANADYSFRSVIAHSVMHHHPVPALSAALAYIDDVRRARGTANMLQAQRDFFGAHSFERIDAEGAHHGPWGLSAQS